MTMAGNIPAFFLPVSVQGKRMSPQAPLLPGHAGHGPVVFYICNRRAVCGLCRASILAGLAGMQG